MLGWFVILSTAHTAAFKLVHLLGFFDIELSCLNHIGIGNKPRYTNARKEASQAITTNHNKVPRFFIRKTGWVILGHFDYKSIIAITVRMTNIAVLIDGLELGREVWYRRVRTGIDEVAFGRMLHTGNELISFNVGRLTLDGKSVLLGENPRVRVLEKPRVKRNDDVLGHLHLFDFGMDDFYHLFFDHYDFKRGNFVLGGFFVEFSDALFEELEP